MKEIIVESDINLICIRAKSFPEGIQEAFENITSKFAKDAVKDCFGIYENTESGIVYRAAILAESISEKKANEFEEFTIEKGKYLSTTITGWQNKTPLIGPTFDKMLKDERVDKNSKSIEMYKGKDELICMVKFT